MREEMVKCIVAAVDELLGHEHDVQFKEVRKNNGLLVKCIVIYESGAKAHPSIPIDSFLDEYASGEINIYGVAAKVVDAYKNAVKEDMIPDASCFFDKKYILERVVYQVINAEKNVEQLNYLPHKKFLDLAVVYRVNVSEDEFGVSSFLVKHVLCEHCNISEDELDFAARRNTEAKDFYVRTMGAVLAEIMDVPEETIKELTEAICDDVSMWVMSSSSKCNGACIMLYNEYFDNLAQRLESDLYVMPSSIHEVIAVPAKIVEVCDLKNMVSEINISEVCEEDILSDNVYIYRRAEGVLSIAKEMSSDGR